jgi:hypothetical protein
LIDLIFTPIPGTDLPILVVAGVIGLWLYLRSKSNVESTSALNAILGRGQPTVLQFFSNT